MLTVFDPQVIVADSEKENIGHQSLRNRQTAGQAKANLVLATEQSAVNIAHLEAKVSEGVVWHRTTYITV